MENLYAIFQIRETVFCSQMFIKIGVLKNVANWKGLQLFVKETPAQLFSCETEKNFKNIFFYRTPLVAASEIKKIFNFQRFLLWLAFSLKHVALQVIQISFASNREWRLKRKHSPAKCVICTTEIHRMEIRLYINFLL